VKEASHKTAMGAIFLAIHLYDFLSCVLITQDFFGRVLFRIDEENLKLASDSYSSPESHMRVMVDPDNPDVPEVKSSVMPPLQYISVSEPTWTSPTSPTGASTLTECISRHDTLSYVCKRRPNIWTNPEIKRSVLMALLLSARVSLFSATEFCHLFITSGMCSDELRPLALRVLGAAHLTLNTTVAPPAPDNPTFPDLNQHCPPDEYLNPTQEVVDADLFLPQTNPDLGHEAPECHVKEATESTQRRVNKGVCFDSGRKRQRASCFGLSEPAEIFKKLAAERNLTLKECA